MFTKKPIKKEKEKKDMIIWYSKSSYPSDYWVKNTCFRVVSIDPGIVNFCIRVEDRYRDGTVKTVFTERKEFQTYTESYVGVYNDLTNYFNSLLEFTYYGHYYIIERQVIENYQSVRTSQHILTYFLGLCKDSPISPLILEIDSKAKYKMLGAPKNYNKVALKAWGSDKAKDLLTERGEVQLVEYINGIRGVRGQKKQDDLCDVVIQSEAFFKLYPIY